MADISTITLLDNSVVNVKDATARLGVANLESSLSTKLNISQGSENAGKILGIDDNGNVRPVSASSGSGDGDVTGPDSAVDGHVATFDGTTGKEIKDSGFTIGVSVPSDAVFTDTTYESKSASSGGTEVSLVTTGEKYTWNSKTDNVGTVTGIKMNNGSAINPDANGIVNLGTVITQHQDISGKADVDALNALATTVSGIGSSKGEAGGLAELDSNGKVPSTQLPSYVDDVIEYSSSSGFPLTGESGKIYVALDTNKTYRWSGSDYVEIGSSLALGETSSTAYRGDRGKAAYDHATDSNRSTTAQSNGFYKIATTAQGHVASVTAVQKTDIANLGIPEQDTKNTAGATDTSSKIFLVGATSQDANPQTYSHDTAYVGTDGCLYSDGKKVLTNSDTDIKINAYSVTGLTNLKTYILNYVLQTTSNFLIHSVGVNDAPELIDADESHPISLIIYIRVTAREAVQHWTGFTCYAYPCLDYEDLKTHRPFILAYSDLNGAQWTLQKMAFTSESSIVTAAAGSWSSATPPTQSITVNGVNTNTNLVVGIANTATAEEIDAATEAKIVCTSQDDDEITLTCYGEEPEINILISVMIVG